MNDDIVKDIAPVEEIEVVVEDVTDLEETTHWPLEAFIKVTATPAKIAAELARRGIVTPQDVRRKPAAVGKAFALAYKPDVKRVFHSVKREAR